MTSQSKPQKFFIPGPSGCLGSMILPTFLILILAGFIPSWSKIVKTSSHPNYQAAVDACVAGDVLIFDSRDPSNSKTSRIKDPPSGIQIVEGKAYWEFTKDVSDLVFFNHHPEIIQTGGKFRKSICNTSFRGSRFTHLDSVFTIMGSLSRDNVNVEVDGFLRHSTFLWDGSFMGSSAINFNSPNDKYGDTWVKHASNFVINADDPVGDGSGTMLANLITHGQVDWTPIHIINGRGIEVAHVNTEYVEWADPFVSMENCVECVLFAHNPGGRSIGEWRETAQELPDGTVGYKTIGNRLGAWRVGGWNNTAIGGTRYVQISSGVTGQAWSELLARDPYITKWDQVLGGGINFAPPLHWQGFRNSDRSVTKDGKDPIAETWVASIVKQCTTGFVFDGSLNTGGLKEGSIRPGPSLYRPYTPSMPKIELNGDGPGINMGGRSTSDIASAGGNVIYLPAGTYEFNETLEDLTIYGAGMDETVLKFPDNIRATQGYINMYNLTIEGGSYGYAQSHGGPNLGWHGSNVRFRGQKEAGMTFGNAQNVHLQYLHFENLPSAITTCGDNIPCGERANGRTMIDKFNVYNSTFKNLEFGSAMGISLNGFTSWIGCYFENISNTAIKIKRAGDKNEGHLIAGCDFVNVGKATFIDGYTTIQNCNIDNTEGGGEGFKGHSNVVISSKITGAEPAITVEDDGALISDVISDGSLVINSTKVWVGKSKFSNLDVTNGAQFDKRDISQYVWNEEPTVDQSPPPAPAGLKVQKNGAHNVLTWDPSFDPESRVYRYIIERNGEEIGRTVLNYSAVMHVIPGDDRWDGLTWDGPGVWKNKTVYVDSNAAGSYNESDYNVVALNSAMRRSDGQMAQLRLWFNTLNPMRLTENEGGKWVRTDDSVKVPLGPLNMTERSGGKSYVAADYKAVSESGVSRGITEITRKDVSGLEKINTPLNRTTPKSIEIYDFSGRKVLTLSSEQWQKIGSSYHRLNLKQGLYLVPALNKKFSILPSR